MFEFISAGSLLPKKRRYTRVTSELHARVSDLEVKRIVQNSEILALNPFLRIRETTL